MKNKICSTCKIKQLESEFSKDPRNKDGLQSQCKSCQKKHKEKPEVKERNSKSGRRYYSDNKDKQLKYQKEYREKPEIKKYRKKYKEQWDLDNKEHILEYNKHWKLDHPEHEKNKRATDPTFKMVTYYRSRTNKALKENWKSGHTIELLGCTGSELMDYLEKRFYTNMTRDNYGEVWHVDHIKPCSSFDLSKSKEQRKCFHYSNLQPLLKEDNLKKSNKITQ